MNKDYDPIGNREIVQPFCQHEGCGEYGEMYTIQGYDPEPIFCFCPDHAAEFGFCVVCGAFIGGTEDVFRVGQTGLCFDCFIELREEPYSSEYDEWDDEGVSDAFPRGIAEDEGEDDLP